MNIENYKTFLELSRMQNYSKTAERLNVVQSTVSSRINELEKYLDIQLFRRNNRKVELTKMGKALIPHAQKLIEIESDIKKHVYSYGVYQDSIKIGIPGSVYREKLSPLIYKFYDLYPQYSIDLNFCKTTTQIQLLLNNEIDIGFISRIPNTNKLIVEPLLDYSWIIVAHTDYDIPNIIEVDQLKSINICYNNQNEQYNEWLKDILPTNYTPKMNMNSTAQLIEHVLGGYGCAFLPSYAVENEISSGKMKKILIKNVTPNNFTIYLAINKNRVSTEIVSKFIELVKP